MIRKKKANETPQNERNTKKDKKKAKKKEALCDVRFPSCSLGADIVTNPPSLEESPDDDDENFGNA